MAMFLDACMNTPRITLVDTRQTSSMFDPLTVGKEVEDAANSMIDRLVYENAQEKCRLFAVTGMGGIGKTTLAQKIFNHETIKDKFNLKIWVCVSQRYLEIDLLRRIIRGAKGSYRDDNNKEELQLILSDSVASGKSLFLVLDDVWRPDVWVELLRVPLFYANTTVRVLVTTRDGTVAKGVDAAPPIHHVEKLSKESSWDMLRELVSPKGEEEQANELKELGSQIVEKCGHLPLAIKAVAGVMKKKEMTKKAWNEILSNKAWSDSILPQELRGFITEEEEENLSMEDVAEAYFNELVLQPAHLTSNGCPYKMRDLIRSLANWSFVENY